MSDELTGRNTARKSFTQPEQQPSRSTARKSLTRPEQHPRRNGSDDTSSSVERQRQEAGNFSTQSRRIGSQTTSVSSKEQGQNTLSSSVQKKRNASKSPSASTKGQGKDVQSSPSRSKQNVSKSSLASSKRQGQNVQSSPAKLMRTEGKSSSNGTETQRQDAETIVVYKGMKDLQKSKKLPSRKRSQISSASSNQQKEVAGSGSEAPIPKPTTTSSGNTDESGVPFVLLKSPNVLSTLVFIPETGEKAYIEQTSSSENETPSASSERHRHDGGGSCDPSKRFQNSSANPEQQRQDAGISSENPKPSTSSFEIPMPSASSSASTKEQRDGAGSSSKNLVPSTSSSARKVRKSFSDGGSSSSEEMTSGSGSREPKKIPERSKQSTSNRDVVPLMPPEQLRGQIISHLSLSDTVKCCRASKTWNNVTPSSKEPWNTLSAKYGFVYTASEENEAYPNKYKRFLFALADRVLPEDNPAGFEIRDVGCRYFRGYPPFDFYLTIKAFHYFNNKCVIVSQFRTIRVFDMTEGRPRRISRIRSEDREIHISNIICVKLTDIGGRTHVVCLTDGGLLCIWNTEDPTERLKEKPGRRHSKRPSFNRGKLTTKYRVCAEDLPDDKKPVCFDLLQDTNLLVAFGIKGRVEIHNIFTTECVNIPTDVELTIVKVMLAPDCSPEQHRSNEAKMEVEGKGHSGSNEAKMEVEGKGHSGSNEAKTEVERKDPSLESLKIATKLFLFAMDEKKVYARKVKFFQNTIPPAQEPVTTDIGNLDVVAASDPPNQGSSKFCNRPTFCFDGTTYLYFPARTYGYRTRRICQYNVESREFSPDIVALSKIDQLLGAGRNYLAYITRNINASNVKLHILSLRSRSEIVRCRLPSDYLGGERPFLYDSMHESSVVGERSWLDGLDGTNDTGVICCYQAGSYRLAYVKWKPKPAF